MSYESTKTSTNLSGGDTMTSDMPSQSPANNFYPNSNSNSTNRTQAMIMNPMMGLGNFYNGPPQGPAPQQAQMPARPMYQSYPSAGGAPPHPPPHPPPHHHPSSQQQQIVSAVCLFTSFSFASPNRSVREGGKSIIDLFSCHRSIPTKRAQLVITLRTLTMLPSTSISSSSRREEATTEATPRITLR